MNEHSFKNLSFDVKEADFDYVPGNSRFVMSTKTYLQTRPLSKKKMNWKKSSIHIILQKCASSLVLLGKTITHSLAHIKSPTFIDNIRKFLLLKVRPHWRSITKFATERN